MEISHIKTEDLKERLNCGESGITDLLHAMKEDTRVSVRKAADIYIKHRIREEKERERVLHLYELETAYYNQGIYHVAGIDEAGRGPAAGPVMVAAVILPPFWECPGINDSKKLSPAKREALYDKIMTEAVSVSCVSKSEKEIDRLNIYHATRQGMYDAVAGLDTPAAAVLIDAMPLYDLTVPHESIIHGDGRSASIAAASIIAKVTRDRLMIEYDVQYPQYGFAIHKGYLTQKHMDAIYQYGPCPIHRKSFEPIKSLVKGRPE
ncbi:ribonuclease HII [Megasphaera cerevisiae]|uniref:ribonuclease HII n=1 Tax=Megasphaera cerevisiae TaxID=39029 RepID=UPI000943C553|nr:ribonuclease HII [Megasphaera cerevisiae]OKY54788.1 ribonuclease HII [Megasphaera cerevisiae]